MLFDKEITQINRDIIISIDLLDLLVYRDHNISVNLGDFFVKKHI